jgi:hypothetical protein
VELPAVQEPANDQGLLYDWGNDDAPALSGLSPEDIAAAEEFYETYDESYLIAYLDDPHRFDIWEAEYQANPPEDHQGDDFLDEYPLGYGWVEPYEGVSEPGCGDVPCGMTGSCEGLCGAMGSAEDCWCDAACVERGDCCPDAQAECPAFLECALSDPAPEIAPTEEAQEGGISVRINLVPEVRSVTYSYEMIPALPGKPAYCNVTITMRFQHPVTKEVMRGRVVETVLLQSSRALGVGRRPRLTSAGIAKLGQALQRMQAQAPRAAAGWWVHITGAGSNVRLHRTTPPGFSAGAFLLLIDVSAAAGKYLPPYVIPGVIDALGDSDDQWARAVKGMSAYLRQRPPLTVSYWWFGSRTRLQTCNECYEANAVGGITSVYLRQIEAAGGNPEWAEIIKEYKQAVSARLAVCAGLQGGRGQGGGFTPPANPVTATRRDYCN